MKETKTSKINNNTIEIRKLIVESDLTQKEIAKRIGIAPETLSRMLNRPLSDRDRFKLSIMIRKAQNGEPNNLFDFGGREIEYR